MSTEHLKRIGKPPKIDIINSKGEKVDLDNILNNDESDSIWKEYIENVSYLAKKLFTFIRYDLPIVVKNLFIWRKTISSTRYWDYSFLLDIERLYLKNTLKRYEKYDMYVGQETVARNIRIMIKLIDMIDENTYFDENSIVNMRNSHRFVHNSLVNKIKADEDCWSYKVLIREEKIWNLYCLIRSYSLRRMWD